MYNSEPLVSIVIPCYNHEQFVQDSIQSVIDQDYENIELIIIDDGSQDDSVIKIQEIIESCKERFVRFEFRSRSNVGLSATLNEATKWCEGKYYSAIASDDVMLNDKTKVQVDFLEDNIDFVGVFGNAQEINERNEYLSNVSVKNKIFTFEKILLHEESLLAPTQMLRFKTLIKSGGYNNNMTLEDWYMWLNISRHGDIYSLDKTLCLYRRHENNISNNLEVMHKGRLQVLNYFKEKNINPYLYKKALKRIRWINACELFINKRRSRLISFPKMLLADTPKTIKVIYTEVSNGLKKKQ